MVCMISTKEGSLGWLDNKKHRLSRAYCDAHIPQQQKSERKMGEVSIYEDGTEEVEGASSDCVFCLDTVERRRILHEVVVHRCAGAVDVYMHLHCSQVRSLFVLFQQPSTQFLIILPILRSYSVGR